MNREEGGYILASALGVLLAISVVAAALIAASADSLQRVVRSEGIARQEAALQSALLAVANQLSIDPRRRQLQLSGTFSVAVFGQDVSGNIKWETEKLDINRAKIDQVEALLQDVGIRPEAIDRAISALQNSKLKQAPVRMVEDMMLGPDERDCIASLVTVFGGKLIHEAENSEVRADIGLPAAGSRLSIDLAIDGRIGLSVVVLMTGDPALPYQVLDWRETNGKPGGKCHVTRDHA